MDARFFLNSILLGAGLAMDAFSISCANALREPKMRLLRMTLIAGVYGLFQFAMPMIGWICVHTIKERFTSIQGYIPWIAFVLLVWIGGKMLLEGIREQRAASGSGGKQPAENPREEGSFQENERNHADFADSVGDQADSMNPEAGQADRMGSASGTAPALTGTILLLQAVATSIDALSVGFTIAGYNLQMAVLSCLIIGVVTFAICMGGLEIGKKAGTRLAGKAGILGGIILIAIGLEIVITSYL